MDLNKIIQSILIFLVSEHYVSSLTVQTEDTIVVTQEDDSIYLNCTYQMESIAEGINNRKIQWQKKIQNEFKIIAAFSPPGGEEPFIVIEMQDLYNNRTTLIGPNVSLSAVMIIENPVCSDKGIYQCLIEYFIPFSDGIKQTNRSVVLFHANAREPEEFVAFPNEVTENQSISLRCRADVGSPRGFIQIWKTPRFSNSTELIYISNSTNNTTDNCTEYINVTTTYTVTRDDNGAIFKCSSRNNLTRGPGPSKKSSRISVTYGPSLTRIETSFSKSRCFVGDHVNMECFSDGNPYPNYTWRFNLTKVVSDAKYTLSVNKSVLSFTITNITDSGHYQCVASSNINGHLFNSSSNVTLVVQEKDYEADLSFIEQPCSENSCLIIEKCAFKDGRVNCSLNIWSVISFPFIALTFVLCTITISLVLSRKKQQKKDNIKKCFNLGDVHVSYTRETFEDFGGYADPKDVKRPENGQIKSEKDGRDNPYADPVDLQTQYAVVQKTWETPARSSNDKDSPNPSNLVNNTDSSKTKEPSETPNPKNLSSNEKTPASTETSETIPKPPNVYDDAWV